MSSLLDVWGDPETSGIFTVLNNYSVPWKSDNIYQSLNLGYYYNHSGQKNISPLMSGILGTSSTLTDDDKAKVGKLIYDLCHQNWEYEYNAMFTDYNPIENYNADETETNTGTDNTSHTGTDTTTRTGTDTHALSGTDSETHTGTDKFAETGDDITKDTGDTTSTNTNKDGTSETINGIAGFNSDEYSKDNKSTTTVNQTITDKREDNLTSTLTHGKNTDETRDLADSTTYGRTDTENVDISEAINYNNGENKTINNTRTLKRHGNIGVTTSQQMIESELELRKKFFYEIVFRDIDMYLTLAVY